MLGAKALKMIKSSNRSLRSSKTNLIKLISDGFNPNKKLGLLCYSQISRLLKTREWVFLVRKMQIRLKKWRKCRFLPCLYLIILMKNNGQQIKTTKKQLMHIQSSHLLNWLRIEKIKKINVFNKRIKARKIGHQKMK